MPRAKSKNNGNNRCLMVVLFSLSYFRLQSYENILISEELRENIVRGRTVANIFLRNLRNLIYKKQRGVALSGFPYTFPILIIYNNYNNKY